MENNKIVIEKRLKDLISARLQEIRKTNGLSLEKMAQALDLNYTVLFHLISGRYVPRLTTLFQISEFYNIPMEYWFKDLSSKEKSTLIKNTSHATLIKNFDKLDEAMQTAVLKIVRKLNIKEKKHKFSS